LQEAAALALKEAQTNGYFKETALLYQKHCHELNQILSDVGFSPIVPDGGYFTVADISKVPCDTQVKMDIQRCQYLTTEVGVTPIPISPFFHHDPPMHFGRFAYCKDMSTLRQAGKRLKRWSQ
jgi:kynurenine aminotransferase